MRIDEKIDHGPIVAQAEVTVNEWPTYEEFEEMMAHAGAKLLADVLPKWVSGMIKEREQDHSAATTTKWIKKEDGLIDFANEPYSDFRKIQAFHQWPSAYFLVEHRGKMLRVKIAKASFERSSPQRGILVIERVLPEGAREMSYADFLKGYAKTAKS
ncbi:MAG: methionyl-tRNA formyltransferase [Candidatus Parcubacteria bacterium]|nr:methionyl-tRNA formyltransferase [Candidatus Parcubacteria bacterium]